MSFSNQELIEKLRLELNVVERGGYAPSVHEPRRQMRIFRDSASCPNVDLEVRETPCRQCFLIEFVPPEHQDQEDPCYYILANAQGETITPLIKSGDAAQLLETLRSWLQETIARLEKEKEETASERPAAC